MCFGDLSAARAPGGRRTLVRRIPQDLAALQCPASNDCIALTFGFPGRIPVLVFSYGSHAP